MKYALAHVLQVPFVLASILVCAPATVGAQTAQRYELSQDGAEVTDTSTGLIWRRCVEGKTYVAGRNCFSGVAIGYTFAGALARAQQQAEATGVAWRVPNIKELNSIVDRSRRTPAIDLGVFPDVMPVTMYWSSTPREMNVSAWGVHLYDGDVKTYGWQGSAAQGGAGYLRLVRNAH